MKKQFLFIAVCVFSILHLSTNTANAQSVDETTTVFWAFDAGTDGQMAAYSGTTSDYFKPDHVSLGNNLNYDGSRTEYDETYTLFNPNAQTGASADNIVGFNVWPVLGLDFTPTFISFNMLRFGTDGGNVDIVWKDSEGNSTVIATGLKPIRNKGEVAWDSTASSVSYNLTGLNIQPSDGECTLEVYIYNLGDTKQAGLSNVLIEGTVQGTVINIPTYTVTSSVSPAESGTIVSSPVGDEFDSNTVVTLTAEKNFGYEFSHWENEAGAIISSTTPYSFTLLESIEIVAVYNTLNTYELALNVDGGGKDYMIDIAPEGTMVGDARMYEEGTNVTLTASENNILTFTNWNNGSTNAGLSVKMTADKNVTASYGAVDYIAAWDFYVPGNSGRVADFYASSENETAALILQDADGVTKSWLDKSIESANGYEGEGAAVNWNPLTDQYYYQISFDATNYTDIEVTSSMLLNYNAYSVQKYEFSFDNINFYELGTLTLSATKVWYPKTIALPDSADNKPMIYFRWIPDYTSNVLGSTSDNDGTALAQIYVTANEAIFDDGIAPVLSASIPANDATGASASGKIILTFDEKVQIADTVATIGNKKLSPKVVGKTITFPYNGLEYNTEYTFVLEDSLVADLSGNTLYDSVKITFTTLDRPTVDKKVFDFVVGIDGSFADALDAANAASSSGERFHMFFPDGEYNIGALTGDGNEMTTISIPKVSYIGQSIDNVVVYNQATAESINTTATMYFTGASSNIYMQDLTLLNKGDYGGERGGRYVVLWDQGDKNIYKNIKLLSNQDTYYTGGDIRTYHENTEIYGTVDYICGGGDIFFNECTLFMTLAGGYITAPATSTDWGYVFSNCTLDGVSGSSGSFNLGRPWSNEPKAAFINTTMKVVPTAAAWGDPMNVVPSVFAEYNSVTASGTPVNTSNRRTTYTKNSVTVVLDPVLSDEEAAEYTIENVLGGTDTWQPKLYTEQSTAPAVTADEDTTKLIWDNSDYVLCFGIFLNNKFVEFTIDTSYVIPDSVDAGVYTVRAANEMGGLSESSNKFLYNTAFYNYELTVTDGDAAVVGAAISFNGDSYTSNEEGKITINELIPGTYPCSISALGFNDSTFTVELIDADIDKTVELTAAFDVNFTISDGVNAIFWATISINGNSYNVDANGQVTIPRLNAGSYGFTVTAAGFNDSSTTVIVSGNDVDVDFVMSQTTSIENEISENMHLYPNPASNELFVKGLDANATIYIYNTQGQMVLYKQAGSSTESIDISALSNGFYCVKTGNTTIPFVIRK